MGATISTSEANKSGMSGLKLKLERNITFLGPLATLFLLVALFAILAPGTFLSSGNIVNVLSQVSVLAI